MNEFQERGLTTAGSSTAGAAACGAATPAAGSAISCIFSRVLQEHQVIRAVSSLTIFTFNSVTRSTACNRVRLEMSSTIREMAGFDVAFIE